MSVGVSFLDDLLHLESVVFWTTKKLPWGATVPPYFPFWTARLFLRLNSFDFKDIFTQRLTQNKLISTKKHFSSARQMGGRSFTSSKKHIQNKVDNFQVSQNKKNNHTTASWQHCQAAFSNGTLNRGEAQSPPSFFPSIPPSSFLKTRNHIIRCCFVFFPSFRLQLQLFYPINPSLLKRKIRATWELIMDEKLSFVLDKIQTQTKSKYFGKRILFTLENSSWRKNVEMKKIKVRDNT